MATSFADSSGGISRHYDECLGTVMFEPYAVDLARNRDAPSARVAAGVGDARSNDLEEEMVSYAREAVPLAEIVWRTADAQALPFADESFDVVGCQFGIMFLPEAARGFGEAHRVLAPGGTLLATPSTHRARRRPRDGDARGRSCRRACGRRCPGHARPRRDGGHGPSARRCNSNEV